MPDKEKPAEKLRKFVSEVAAEIQTGADKISVSRENAIAAVNFIAGKLDAAAKGGSISKGGGRKISNRKRVAVKNRLRMREVRKNKKAEEESK